MMKNADRFPDMRIRLATPEDAPALARLRYDFRASAGTPTESMTAFVDRCAAWMGSRLATGGRWRCWLVEVGGAIRGNVWLQVIEKLPNPVEEAERHAYISSLYVETSLRGAGVGSALLERCLRECEALSVDAVILWTTPESRGLYERRGFAVRDDLLERR